MRLEGSYPLSIKQRKRSRPIPARLVLALLAEPAPSLPRRDLSPVPDLESPVTFPSLASLLRKEVIQPLVLERLPCYDFTPIIEPTFGHAPLAVRLWTSGVPDSHGVTGGVYKARERIHRGMLTHDY